MTMLSNLAPIPELYVSYESAQKLKVEAGNLNFPEKGDRQKKFIYKTVFFVILRLFFYKISGKSF